MPTLPAVRRYPTPLEIRRRGPVQVCTRCVVDSTVPDVVFDERGQCTHCRVHDRLNKICPVGDVGQRFLERMAERMRRHGRGRDYDCVVGFSGGRDTSYCLYVTKQLGLRPLAVHFDNGWDSDLAKNNIRKMCNALQVDLHSVIADWEESRELTNCTIRASVPYIDLTDDVGIARALFNTAVDENVRWIIHSHSYRTEGINPHLWNYCDGKYVRGLIEQFCRIPLKQFKNAELSDFFRWTVLKRIRVFTITNYYDDSSPEIDALLKREFGWEDTGGWHFDNEIFGLQCFYSRHKFGIDWRLFEIAALVRERVMTRDDGLAALAEIPAIERPEFVEYALKKQGISPEEWQQILSAEPKYFLDYPNSYRWLERLKWPIWLFSRLNFLPPHTYEKFFVL